MPFRALVRVSLAAAVTGMALGVLSTLVALRRLREAGSPLSERERRKRREPGRAFDPVERLRSEGIL